MTRPRLPWCFAMGLAVLGCGASDEQPKPDELLTPPPQGKGVQLSTGEFEVPPGTEIQNCHFFQVRELNKLAGLPENDPFVLHRTEIAFRDGSHHMNIFRVRTIVGLDPANGAVQPGTDGVGECFKSPNWADWPLLANSQNDESFDWTYPEGVGNELMPDEWLMLQTHYVNATTQVTPGSAKVEVNFWNMPKADLVHQLGTLFATKQSIRVCQSNPTPKFSGSCQFNSPQPVNIIGANAHFHSRGKSFDMFAWDGTSSTQPAADARFYSSESWDDPPMMKSPDLDLPVPAGAGIWYTCAYQWAPPPPSIGCEGLNALDQKANPGAQPDCCYTFGGVVDRSEHCNIFAYYYPKADDVNCF